MLRSSERMNVKCLGPIGCLIGDNYELTRASAVSGVKYDSRGRSGRSIRLLLCLAVFVAPVCSFAFDESGARDLAQSSGCFKCHGTDKKKDGPALRDVAAKYKSDPEAESKLIHHVTSGEMVKFDDGHEEHHKKVKTSNPDETRNLVQWILALPGGIKH